MRSKAYSLLLVASIVLLCLAGWTSYAQKDSSTSGSKIIWEYKTLRGHRALSEATLNDMGLYGWELIFYDDGQRGNGSFEVTYYFKRPKQ
jgi:hypothetical protein